jgi:uncharacterized peroxidase-related enzyme
VAEFPIQTITSAPEQARPSMERLQEQVGFLPNLAATMATSPALVGAFVDGRQWAARTSLTPLEREVVSLAAAFERHCNYCVAAHSTFATAAGGDANAIDAMRRGLAPEADPRLATLYRFALVVLRARGAVDRRALDDFLDAGYTSEQALDVIVVLATATIANWTYSLTGAALDEPLEPWRWDLAA